MSKVLIAGVGGLTALAWWSLKRRRFGKMTAERKKIFEEALRSLKDPVKLRNLAKSFDKVGLKAEGNELRKRAALREVPKELNQERTKAFQKALSQTDPAKVKAVADAFYKVGAYEAAEKLRKYAANLMPASKAPPKAPIRPKKVA